MIEKMVVVEYMGAEWMVVGEWETEEPFTEYDPPSFSWFSEFEILFGSDSEGNDMDMVELLNEKAIDNIIDLAEIKIRGRI